MRTFAPRTTFWFILALILEAIWTTWDHFGATWGTCLVILAIHFCGPISRAEKKEVGDPGAGGSGAQDWGGDAFQVSLVRVPVR